MSRCRWLVFALVGLPLLVSGCSNADWSPDGTRIVIAWPGSGDHAMLRVVDVRTGMGKALPDTRDAMNPRWSPDGRWIAFSREVGGGQIVHVYDVQTGKSRPIGARDGSVFVWREDSARLLACSDDAALCFAMPGAEPAWEAKLPPQARPVVYGSWIRDTDSVVLAAGNDLWIIEGAEVSRITTTGDVLGFGVRNGGKELLWARSSRNPRYILLSLYAMPLKQRSSRRLPMPYRVAEVNPSPQTPITAVGPVAFSPDGRRMAVTCTYAAEKRRDNADKARVFVMDVNGQNARIPYPETLGESILPPGPTSFSPDSRRLSLLIGTRKTAHLWVCSADGTGGRIVMTTPMPKNMH